MPTKREDGGKKEAPRTDLPPKREPYYEGYFGTGEEEGTERERDARTEDDKKEEAERSAAEDAAGGDREI